MGKAELKHSKDHYIKKSKHFCILPWVHFHLWPNGNFLPCCIWDSSFPMGNVNTNTLKEVWNSQKMRDLRLKMIEDEAIEQCKTCYFFEQDLSFESLRSSANLQYQHLFNRVEETSEDGTSEDVHMAYMDIRFSNVCNFKCRSCGPDLSTKWYEDAAVYDPGGGPQLPLRLRDNDRLFDELEPLLGQVEEVYFAGGEVFIIPEHYEILEKWVQSGHTKVRLNYTTNLSQLSYGRHKALDYWKHFDEIHINGSLDASGARGELIRKGTNWKKVEENRRTILEKAPNVNFTLNPTIGILNIIHFPDFHRDWIEKGLLKPHEIRVNLLRQPLSLRSEILPYKFRQKLKQKYEDHYQYLVGKVENEADVKQIRSNIDAVLQVLDHPEEPENLAKFKEYMGLLDMIRNEKLVDVIPELEFLYQDPEKVYG